MKSLYLEQAGRVQSLRESAPATPTAVAVEDQSLIRRTWTYEDPQGPRGADRRQENDQKQTPRTTSILRYIAKTFVRFGFVIISPSTFSCVFIFKLSLIIRFIVFNL